MSKHLMRPLSTGAILVTEKRELVQIIEQLQARIAELEAEVERLKAFCNEWVHNEEAFQKQSAVEVCPIITEEGQG